MRHVMIIILQLTLRRLSGSPALWLSGSSVLWLSGSLALWLSGSLALWLSGSARLRRDAGGVCAEAEPDGAGEPAASAHDG